MRNIAKRSVAWIMLAVMLFSYFSSALPTATATENEGTEPVIIVATEPSEPEDDPEENSSEPVQPTTMPTEDSTNPSEDTSGSCNEPESQSSSETDPVTEPTELPTDGTEPKIEITNPTEEVTEPVTEPETKPTEPATEVTEPETEPTSEATEPETLVEDVTEPSEEPTSPVVVYSKMEAETQANYFRYDEEPVEVKDASNGYVVGGNAVESVFDLELFDDLGSSSLSYTPYVKYNVSAESAGTYTLYVGVYIGGVDNVEEFYIPVVVDGEAYKATCEEFENIDGLYEFAVDVSLSAGKNEVYCIAYDADTYLELIRYDINALSDAEIAFDYLGIPEGVSALPKDVEEEVVEPTTVPTEPSEATDPTESSGETDPTDVPTEPSEETNTSTLPTDPSEATDPTDPEDDKTPVNLPEIDDSEDDDTDDDDFLVPGDVIDPDGGGTPSTYTEEGSSSSGTGNNTGSENHVKPGSGDLQWCAPGVTMQVVLYPYGETYNRTLSYNNVINTLQSYTYGDNVRTVYNGYSTTLNTFVSDPFSGRVFKLMNYNRDAKSFQFKGAHGNEVGAAGVTIHAGVHNTVSGAPSYVKVSDSMYTVTMPEMNDIEAFIQRIILGNAVGSWDATSVAKNANGVSLATWPNGTAPTSAEDVSLFARVLRYLGVSETLVNNYVRGYTGQLDPMSNPNDPNSDYNVMIPTIIWSYVYAECRGGPAYVNDGSVVKSYKYYDGSAIENFKTGSTYNGTLLNVASSGSYTYTATVYCVGDIVRGAAMGRGQSDSVANASFQNWWKSSYVQGEGGTSPTTQAYTAAMGGYCGWNVSSSYACTYLLGTYHYNGLVHGSCPTRGYGTYAHGSGFVNQINAEGVDNNTGNRYYFRGYWTPYAVMTAGSASVQKAVKSGSTSSADLKDWKFELYGSEADAKAGTASKVRYTAYTNSSGVATFTNVFAGTYYLREAPAERQDRRSGDSANWGLSTEVIKGNIIIGGVVRMGTITNNDIGSLSVQKKVSASALNTEANLRSWKIRLYATESDAINETNPLMTGYTGVSGVVTFNNLKVGKTYYIREASVQDKRSDIGSWKLSTSILSGNVKANVVTSVGTISNIPLGNATVTKTVTSTDAYGYPVANWKFELYRSQEDAVAGTNCVISRYTNSEGIATFTNLGAGITYYVREAPPARQDRIDTSGWVLSTTVLVKEIALNQTVSFGSINNPAPGRIGITKKVTTGNSTDGVLEGWLFYVATDEAFTDVVCTLTTDENGKAYTDWNLTRGHVYYVKEAPMSAQTRSDKYFYTLDTSVKSVVARAGQSIEVNYTFDNVEQGWIIVRKGAKGAEELDDPYSGWVFNVFNDAACTNKRCDIVLREDGYGVSRRLPVGTYYVREAPLEEQTREDKLLWHLDNSITEVKVTAGSGSEAFGDGRYTATNYYSKKIKLTKAPSSLDCWEQLKDNAMYSLAGAKFQLIVDGSVVETITTGADGTVVSQTSFVPGTEVTIKEIVAPKGFLLNSTPKTITISADSNEYSEVTMQNIPTFDPDTPTFTKVDPVTGNPQGGASFEGAVFKMEYYDNLTWDGTPIQTWYFETNSDGIFWYNNGYISSKYTSSDLYISPSGRANLPLGSVKLSEVEVPYGYSKIPDLYATITQPTSGNNAVFAWTPESQSIVDGSDGNYTLEEPVDEDTWGNFSIRKNDIYGLKNTQGDVPNLKAKFQVINKSANSVKIGDFAEAEPGSVCYEFWTDEAGDFTSEKIFPVGTYQIKEVTPPTGMSLNANWSKTFSITKDVKTASFTTKETACANAPYYGGIVVHKFDSDDNTNKSQGEATLEGAVFKVINKSKYRVVTDRDGNGTLSWYYPGQVCLYITTNENGIAESAVDALPYGTYMVMEHSAPTGYQLNTTWSKTFTIRSEGEIAEFARVTDSSDATDGAVPEDIIRGGVRIVKYDAVLGTDTTKDAKFEGITYAIYSKNDNYVYVNGVKYTNGDVVAEITLEWDADEKKWVAQLDGDVLPYGTYTIKEKPMDDTKYANDYYFLCDGEYKIREYTFSIRNNGEIVTTSVANEALEFSNLPKGEIKILKEDTRGKKLEGVKFMLQWSTDGTTWRPVAHSSSDNVSTGTTSSGTLGGTAITEADGTFVFKDLDPRHHYRLVELETLNNLQLLQEPIYIGILCDNPNLICSYVIRVINEDVFTLPKTGSKGMVNMSVSLAICATICFGALAYFKKKEEEV